MADDDGRLAFENALARIGFAGPERQAFISQSGCTNIALLGLLPSNQVAKMCKRLIMKWGPVKQVLESKGIQPQHSLPYAHYQNLAERYVQTIVKAVSTNLHGQSLLKANLWDYALFYVINCKNSTPNSRLGRETPSQMVTRV